MSSTNTPAPRRSTTATISLVSAVISGVAVIPSLSINGFGGVLVGVLFAGWVSLPLLLLGLVKLFRQFATAHIILLVLGLVGSFGAVTSPYGHGSTSALGMLVLPFFLLAAYGVVGFALFCVKAYRT